MTTPRTLRNFIGGAYVDADAGATSDVVNPSIAVLLAVYTATSGIGVKVALDVSPLRLQEVELKPFRAALLTLRPLG